MGRYPTKPVTIAGVNYPSITKARHATGIPYVTIAAAVETGTTDKLTPVAAEPKRADASDDAALLVKVVRERDEAYKKLEVVGAKHAADGDFAQAQTQTIARLRSQLREYEITVRTILSTLKQIGD